MLRRFLLRWRGKGCFHNYVKLNDAGQVFFCDRCGDARWWDGRNFGAYASNPNGPVIVGFNGKGSK